MGQQTFEAFCHQSLATCHHGLASVAGLAPARVGLKIRVRELLCIHGRRTATGVGIAPTPPDFQTGVQTDYTIQ